MELSYTFKVIVILAMAITYYLATNNKTLSKTEGRIYWAIGWIGFVIGGHYSIT